MSAITRALCGAQRRDRHRVITVRAPPLIAQFVAVSFVASWVLAALPPFTLAFIGEERHAAVCAADLRVGACVRTVRHTLLPLTPSFHHTAFAFLPAVLLAFTLPKVYELKKDEIDKAAAKVGGAAAMGPAEGVRGTTSVWHRPLTLTFALWCYAQAVEQLKKVYAKVDEAVLKSEWGDHRAGEQVLSALGGEPPARGSLSECWLLFATPRRAARPPRRRPQEGAVVAQTARRWRPDRHWLDDT